MEMGPWIDLTDDFLTEMHGYLDEDLLLGLHEVPAGLVYETSLGGVPYICEAEPIATSATYTNHFNEHALSESEKPLRHHHASFLPAHVYRDWSGVYEWRDYETQVNHKLTIYHDKSIMYDWGVCGKLDFTD